MNGDFELGEWAVHPKLNAVVRDNASRHMSPKAGAVLVFLAERQGDVVSKEDIHTAVWPGTFVTDDALTRCIGELRRVFEDDAREPTVIQTIAKRGYRLVPPVRWLRDDSAGQHNGDGQPDQESASASTSERPAPASLESPDVGVSPSEAPVPTEFVGGVPPVVSTRVSRRVTIAAASFALITGVVIGVAVMARLRPLSDSSRIVSAIDLEPGYVLAGRNSRADIPTRTAMAISSDGSFVVYSAKREGTGERCLFIRRLDKMKTTAIAGTEGGIAPFLSPDDRRVGFVVDGQLKTVSIDGGPATPLGVAAAYAFGASWGPDGYIAFSSGAGLSRIHSNGGKPEDLTTPSANESHHRLPHYLPRGRSVLFTVARRSMDPHPQIAVVDEAHRTHTVLDDAADARYVDAGYLVFVREGTLMAVPFDLDRLRTTGPVTSLGIGVAQAMNAFASSEETDAGQFAVSHSGVLVYVGGGIIPDEQHSLVWVDQRGQEVGRAVPFTAPFMAARLSPDERKIVYTVSGMRSQVGVFDLDRGAPSALTKGGRANFAIWTDNQRVVFGWSESGPSGLLERPIDQSSPAHLIAADQTCTGQGPGSWSPDLKLAFWRQFPDRDKPQQILIFDRKSGATAPFTQGRPGEVLSSPEFSPDGHWLAYTSNESGRSRVYVTAFPEGGTWPISSEMGTEPLWARDGKRLFWRARAQVWAVDLDTAAGLDPGRPRLLFSNADKYLALGPSRTWDVSRDGQRFLMVKLEDIKPQSVTKLVLVQNWLAELKPKAPARR